MFRFIKKVKRTIKKAKKEISHGVSSGARAIGKGVGGDFGRAIASAGDTLGKIAVDAATFNIVGAVGHTTAGIGHAIGGDIGNAISTGGNAIASVGDNIGISGVVTRIDSGISAAAAVSKGDALEAIAHGMGTIGSTTITTPIGTVTEKVAEEKRKELIKLRTEYVEQYETLCKLVSTYNSLTKPAALVVAYILVLSGYCKMETVESDSVDLPSLIADLLKEISPGSTVVSDWLLTALTMNPHCKVVLEIAAQQLNSFAPVASIADIVNLQKSINEIEHYIHQFNDQILAMKNQNAVLWKLVRDSASEYFEIESYFSRVMHPDTPLLLKPEPSESSEYLDNILAMQKNSIQQYTQVYSMFKNLRNAMKSPDFEEDFPLLIESFGENAGLVNKALKILKLIDKDPVGHHEIKGAHSGAGAFWSTESQETTDDETSLSH